MSSEHSSPGQVQTSLARHLAPLRSWAHSARAEADLEKIFGNGIDWTAAYRWLAAFRNGDFSVLPPIHVLPAVDMPGLWGGYSREQRAIFVSDACPTEYLAEALIEEIGHFLDQEICREETPGDEGTRFAAAVLGLDQSGNPALDLPAAAVQFAGSRIPVEAMSARIVQTSANQRLNGTTGNDTFVLFDPRADIQDYLPSIDWIEASASINLDDYFSNIEHLVLTGTANLNGTGNYLDNSIFGNSGNNYLDGGDGNDTLLGGAGNDTLVGISGIDSLVGGSGNDAYYVESANASILELSSGGSDTLYTSNRDIAVGTFANIEFVVYLSNPGPPPGGGGGGGNDTIGRLITGDEFANSLVGGAGNDTISGLAGNDTIVAGAGNDSIDGGTGIDNMLGGAGHDTYFTDTSADVIVENPNEGTDLVVSSATHTLGNNLENLTLSPTLAVADANINGTGNSLDNIIRGNSGNNNLDGRGGADLIAAGAGNDILNGGTGDGAADILYGGTGDDLYIVDSTLDTLVDEGGNDTVWSTVTFDLGATQVSGVENLIYKGSSPATLTGNAANNSLVSEHAGNDTLIGGAGNDTLDAGAGTNSLAGGTGDDLYILKSKSDAIFEQSESLVVGSGLDTAIVSFRPDAGQSNVSYDLGAASHVEVLQLEATLSAGATLSGSDSANTLIGGNFRNSLTGRAGDDYLIGGLQADTLLGGDGDDTLDGRGGADSLVGGTGNDAYLTGSQSVAIVENLGEGASDKVRSTVEFSLSYSSAFANIEGLDLVGTGNHKGIGNLLDNTITGNDGNNTLEGKAGHDTILGGLGADLIRGEDGNDSLAGGGSPLGDLPADASTPVQLGSGQTYTGRVETRNETDWLRLELQAGVTYTFNIDSQLSGAEVVKARSDVAFGAQGSDAYWGWQDGLSGYGQPPLIGDITPSSGLVNGQPWVGHLTDHDELILNADGTVAYGYINPASITKSSKFTNNITGFQFTPFDTGIFYVPVSSAGPATGTYRVTLTDPANPSAGVPALADNAGNTLIGGMGADTLVAGNGRDPQGNPTGDLLIGGTNGIAGRTDTDLSGDTLLGGDGNDTLDGGNGANSLIGGKGDDLYYIRSATDTAVEEFDGGLGDGMVVNFASTLGGAWDIVLDPDHVPTGPAARYLNIENATLEGSTALSVLGSPNADRVVGNFGNNTLAGGTGDDSLFGEGGNDSLIGGEGADYLDGGSGTNTLDGGRGADTYTINDRYDRIANENLYDSLDGGEDLVRTRFNFDPIQGSALQQFQPDQPDNSPSATKSPSFASLDLKSFYNLEHFALLDQASYGVGNSLNNSMSAADGTAALLLGMGGDDSLLGGSGADSLYGDTPRFYATPDLYAPAPTDTRTQEFVVGIGLSLHGNDYLEGGAGNDYLDGGRSFDTMVGGAGTNVFIQDHVDDYIVATGGSGNELVTSVNISRAPDGINDIMLVVKDQDRDDNRLSITGQEQVASFASFLGSTGGNQGTYDYGIDSVAVSVSNANRIELMYSHNVGDTYRSNPDPARPHLALNVGSQRTDEKDNTKVVHELSWSAGPFDHLGVVGYTVRYRQLTDASGTPFLDADGNPGIWKTYLDGTAQDLRGTQSFPSLLVDNLDQGTYEFEVVSNRLAMPVVRYFNASDLAPGANPVDFTIGQALREQVVTLEGGAGNDFLTAQKLVYDLPGGLVDDTYNDPLVQNNPLNPLPLGFLFAPEPVVANTSRQTAFAAYLDGGAGNDLLVSARANGGLGVDYEFQGVTFSGLNTMVGGLGSDTFVVKNGGQAIGDEFDWVVKYGNETPVNYGAGGVGASLNGGQHNLVVSAVPYLTLSDTVVSQGKFIDQLVLSGGGQFGMGNWLDNHIYDAGIGLNTLAGGTGRDSIVGNALSDLLIGGTAYGRDDVGLTVRDFASVIDGGNGLLNSIFRDTDPIPVNPSGPGVADPSQFWFVPGFYGGVYDPNRNQDTLIANAFSTLDGGAGKDSMVGSDSANQVAPGSGDMFFVSQGAGGIFSQSIGVEDAVYGNNGNDTVMFTDSDYLWWSGHLEGSLLAKNGYTIAADISNLILQAGSPSARNATGNDNSRGNYGQGSNIIQGNEFDNEIDGSGVGGPAGTGTGVDVLTGGRGADNFIVNGYTGSETNEWSPEIIDYENGPFAGQSVWKPIDSVYTDADYAVVLDFEAGDNLQLSGPATGYWIGAAPASDGIPASFNNNVPLLGYLDTPNPTRFGIYTAGTPNLVAIVNTVGSLALDTLTLQLAFDPAPSNRVATDSPFRNVLGWGTFWELGSSNFAQYVNQAYIAEDSFASLTTLVRSDDDTFIGGALADYYNGYGGNDSLLGGANNDTLLGDSGNDELFGEAGNDSLLGGIGTDYLDGGIGNDELIGGAGDDTYIVDSLLDNVVELPDAVGLPRQGTDVVEASVSGYTLAANVEYLFLTGSAVDGYGNTLNNRVFGNALDNTLGGGDGNDTMDGGDGTDTLQGGDGDDLYIVDSTTDTIEDTNGTDTVVASVSFDLSDSNINGGTGIEHLTYTGSASASLTGNTLANSLIGGAGNDTLDGRAGTDTLIGGAGDDFYVLEPGTNDLVVDTSGTDTALVSGSFNLSTLRGGGSLENLRLATATAATLSGNALNNEITGNTSNDQINGGAGNDTLSGTSATGSGEIDTLTGGTGADLFVLGNATSAFYNTAAAAGDYAFIRDFSVEQGDLLQLNDNSAYLFGSNNIFGAGIGSANSYLYRDANANGLVDPGDNLIAAILATGGAGTDKNLIASDLAKVAFYV